MIEFFDADGTLGLVAMQGDKLASDVSTESIARSWLLMGQAADKFESAYDGWSNGYAQSRRLEDITDVIDNLTLVEIELSPVLVSSAFHLPGKHDQKNHGRRVGKNLDTIPDLKIPNDMGEDAAFSWGTEPWVFNKDRDKRAVGLWSSSYAGMNSVRQVFRNRANGVDDLKDVGVPNRFNMTVLRMDDYDESNLHDDFRAAAINMRERLDNATTSRTRLYRGMKLKKDTQLNPGDTFNQDLASWTEDQDWAKVYANMDDDIYRQGEVPTIMRLEGPKKSASINDDLPSYMRGSREHIAEGTYRVKKITRREGYQIIAVEEVR